MEQVLLDALPILRERAKHLEAHVMEKSPGAITDEYLRVLSALATIAAAQAAESR